MTFRTLLLTLLLTVSTAVSGSEHVVTGQIVTDRDEPLPYAYVNVEGHSFATQADKSGRFTLRLPEGTFRLTARMVGYRQETRTVVAPAKDTAGGRLVFRLSEDLINLNTVTVTGTRTPKLLANAPVVTQIITADEIEKLDATNIQDVLVSEMPGLEFSFSMDQQVSLSMQGLGGMAILFLVDGERLAGETLDNTDFLRLNTDDIERIEIIKGAASALYGSNSVGAVINIITKRAANRWTANLNTHFGSRHGEQRHGGQLGLGSGRWNSLTSVQTNSTDSYSLTGRSGTDTMAVYGNRQWNFKEKLTWSFTDRTSLTARAGYYFHERNSSVHKKDRARDFSGGLRLLSTTGGQGTVDLSYTFDRYDKSNFYPAIDADFIEYKNVQNTVRALYTLPLGRHVTLTAGGDAMSDYLMSYQFEAGTDHSQWSADMFAQAELTFGDHWTVIGGLRADWMSKAGWNVTPKLAAMYSLGRLRVRGSYSGGFKAPTLKEMYMNFNMANIFTIYGNRDLTAERSHSFALSAEYSHSRYSLTATGYYNIMDNEITTLWDPSRENGRGAMVYHNVSGRNLLGTDVTLAARYPCGIGAKVAYAYFHEFTRNGRLNTSDSRPHSLTAKIDYRKVLSNYEFDVTLSGRYLSSAHYHTFADGDYSSYTAASSPAYTIWKLALSQRFFNAFRLTLTADNLFNYRPKTYEYNSPVTAGTTFAATVAVDIEQLFNRK